jgi:formylglycine-generating enzyme required for sulfatase activity
VTLLAASKAVSGGTFALWPLVDALCDSQPSRGSTVPQEWGSLLAGQIILENANLQQVSTTNQAKVNLIRTWQVHLLKSINLTAHERARAGNTLARLGDPRFDHRHWYLPAEPLLGFIEVPSGTFRMGSDPDLDQEAFEDEKPCDEVILPEFYMARYPVTVAQFRQFIDDSAYRFDRWARNTVPNHPVVSVSWYDAIEYCRWLTIKLCEYGTQRFSGVDPNSLEFPFWQGLAAGSLTVALPSEAEWEKAARGPDSRIYPWGDDFDSGRANTFETGILDTSSVGCFPAGASPYGCEDMSGNVWEWTRSLYVDYPYVSTDGREDLSAGIDSRRVLRGGSFYGNRGLARCAYRSRPVPRNRYLSVGFRVVVSPSVSVL